MTILAFIVTVILALCIGAVLVVWLSRRSRYFKRLINHRRVWDSPKHIQLFRIYKAKVKRLVRAARNLRHAEGFHYNNFPLGHARLLAVTQRQQMFSKKRNAGRSR